MPDLDWIEEEIANFQDRAKDLPASVLEILADRLRGELHKDALTGTESGRLATQLLIALREEVKDAN
jgi:hypothetical protein